MKPDRRGQLKARYAQSVSFEARTVKPDRRRERKMRFWMFLITVVAPFAGTYAAAFGGDYFLNIDKIDNQPELSREYADWHLFVKRLNKNDKILDGYYVVKKNIVGPKAVFSPYILSNGKFYKMAVSELVPTDLCNEKIYNDFVVPYLVGNSTFPTSKSCVMTPGYMTFKKNQTRGLNEWSHKIVNKIIYGTYKLVMKIVNKDQKTMGGATWIVTAKKKE